MNWAIFSLCFQDAVEAKVFGAISMVPHHGPTSSNPKTVLQPPRQLKHQLLPPQTGPFAEELALVTQWEKDE